MAVEYEELTDRF